MRCALVVTIACGVLAVSAAAAAGSNRSAPAGGTPEHICDKPVQAHGYTYGVQGSGVRCPFMRKWAKAWLRHGEEAPHWICIGDRSYEGGTCHRRHVEPPKPYFDVYIFD